MATQIVMDPTGDTRHHFDAKDLKALAEAERRFKALTGNGFTAATRQAHTTKAAPEKATAPAPPRSLHRLRYSARLRSH